MNVPSLKSFSIFRSINISPPSNGSNQFRNKSILSKQQLFPGIEKFIENQIKVARRIGEYMETMEENERDNDLYNDMMRIGKKTE